MFTKLTSVHVELTNVTSSSIQIQLLHCWSGKRNAVGLKSTWVKQWMGVLEFSGVWCGHPLGRNGAESRGHRNRLERWTEIVPLRSDALKVSVCCHLQHVHLWDWLT